MAKRSRQDSLSAELLMSNSSEDEAVSSSSVTKTNQVVQNDPMLELLKSMQTTFTNEFHKLGARMCKIEGEVKKVKKDRDEPRGVSQKERESRGDKGRTHYNVVDHKTVGVSKALAQPKELFPTVKIVVPDVCKARKQADSAPAQTDAYKCDTENPREKESRNKNYSGIKYRKVEQSSNTDKHVTPKAKPKSILMVPVAVKANGETSKRYIELSDDSENSYDEKLARTIPISGTGSISVEQIMTKAAEGRDTNKPVSKSENGPKSHTGGEYRRMTSSGTNKEDQSGTNSKTVQGLDIADTCATLENKQRSSSAASYDSMDDLLASMEVLPVSPSPIEPVPITGNEVPKKDVSRAVAIDVAKQSVVSKKDAAMAVARQASKQSASVASNEFRTRTNPSKVSSGRPAGPIVVDAPTMGKSRPSSGGTTSSHSKEAHKESASAATSSVRDPTRRTQFVTVETSHNKGKEVCLEGELKREKGVNVPYINIVLATNGETGKRPSRFLLKATTMAKLIKGGSFNAVMLKLRQLDPGNPNCDLWV